MLKKPASKTAQKPFLAQKKPASPSTRASNGRSFVVRKTKALPAAVVSAEENSPGQEHSGEHTAVVSEREAAVVSDVMVSAAELLTAGSEAETFPGKADSLQRELNSVKSELSSEKKVKALSWPRSTAAWTRSTAGPLSRGTLRRPMALRGRAAFLGTPLMRARTLQWRLGAAESNK